MPRHLLRRTVTVAMELPGQELRSEDGEPSAARGARPDLPMVLVLAAQALSGLVLMFHYRPTVDTAYLDLVDLREVSGFGFVSALHRWGSHAAVVVAWLALFRSALRGAYRARRAWTASVVLTASIMALALTGHLLPWDADAYWGIAVLAPTSAPPEPAGGEAGSPLPDGTTLLRFYVLHCLILPLIAGGLTVYLLRRSRGPRPPAFPGPE